MIANRETPVRFLLNLCSKQECDTFVVVTFPPQRCRGVDGKFSVLDLKLFFTVLRRIRTFWVQSRNLPFIVRIASLSSQYSAAVRLTTQRKVALQKAYLVVLLFVCVGLFGKHSGELVLLRKQYSLPHTSHSRSLAFCRRMSYIRLSEDQNPHKRQVSCAHKVSSQTVDSCGDLPPLRSLSALQETLLVVLRLTEHSHVRAHVFVV